MKLLAQKSLHFGIRRKIGTPRFVSRHKMLFRWKSLFRWAEIFCCPMNSFSWWGCCDRRQQSCLQQIDKLLVKNFTKQKVFSLSTRIIICHNFGQISVSENFAQKKKLLLLQKLFFLFLHKNVMFIFSEQIFWSIKCLKGQLGQSSHLTWDCIKFISLNLIYLMDSTTVSVCLGTVY